MILNKISQVFQILRVLLTLSRFCEINFANHFIKHKNIFNPRRHFYSKQSWSQIIIPHNFEIFFKYFYLRRFFLSICIITPEQKALDKMILPLDSSQNSIFVTVPPETVHDRSKPSKTVEERHERFRTIWDGTVIGNFSKTFIMFIQSKNSIF